MSWITVTVCSLLGTVAPVLDRVGPFADLLRQAFDEAGALALLRRAGSTGQPTGSAAWIKPLARAFARPLAPRHRERASQHDPFGKLSP